MNNTQRRFGVAPSPHTEGIQTMTTAAGLMAKEQRGERKEA